MASLMSDIKNPFLKDYSTTSLLKKNYSVLLVQSQVKQNTQNYHQQYKKQPQPYKQNLQASSAISNPFSHKSINAYELLQQKRDPQHLKNSEVRSLSQTRSMFGSLDKNLFYKGLEDLGTKQMMKNQMQRDARYQLKHYGVDSLRYQYVPIEYAQTDRYSQEKSTPSISMDRASSKRFDSRKQIQSPKWNVNANSQYYGYYDGEKDKKDYDDFPIRKAKKTSFRQPSSKDNFTDKLKKQRHSYYGANITNIPQDRNQDFQTAHHIKLKRSNNEFDAYRPIEYSSSSQKRISIQNINQNNFHPQQSASSGFGYSSEMYESGANFATRFGKNKGGPLDMDAFDDEKEDFDLDQFDDIGKKSTLKGYADSLEHNNKIYYRIEL